MNQIFFPRGTVKKKKAAYPACNKSVELKT